MKTDGELFTQILSHLFAWKQNDGSNSMSQQYNVEQKMRQTWQRWPVWLYVMIREEIISTEKLVPRSTVWWHNCTHSTLSIQRADRWRLHTLV